jgi:hypothetical protein
MCVTRLGVEASFGNPVIRKLALGGKEGRAVVGDQQQQWEQSIERSLSGAGWTLDYSFEGYLLIGHDGERSSLLAHRELWGTNNPIFEILDHEQMTTCWVREVPTPQEATRLLQERGQPPEEWDLP